MNIDFISIPKEILAAADLISNWAKKNNYKNWELRDICDRSFARKDGYNTGLESALSLIKEADCPYCSETLVCGLENSKRQPVCSSCPNCGNNRQVWRNQLTHKLTCHRVGCNNLKL